MQDHVGVEGGGREPGGSAGFAIEVLRRKLSGFFDLPAEAARDFDRTFGPPQSLAPRQEIVAAGARSDRVFLVADGWALRSRLLPDGSRQIVNVAMPGDVLCLDSIIFQTAQFDITAQTGVVLRAAEPGQLREVLGRDAALAAALFWISAHEEAMLAERVVSLGRRSARVRAAHVLAELICRIEIVDEVAQAVLDLPLTQEDFADILGISVVHANKTLRMLSREGVISLRKGRLGVQDIHRLAEIAGFEGDYLHFTRSRPRRAPLAVTSGK